MASIMRAGTRHSLISQISWAAMEHMLLQIPEFRQQVAGRLGRHMERQVQHRVLAVLLTMTLSCAR